MLSSNQSRTISISKTTPAGAVSPARPARQSGTIRTPSHIYMGQRDKGGEVMTDEHRYNVQNLAHLNWQLHMNEAAKANGLITTSMYEFAMDALHKEIAKLSAVCYNECHKAGGNSGFKVCTATT